MRNNNSLEKVFGGLLAASVIGLFSSPAAADSRVYAAAPLTGAPYVLYDRAEGLFYRAPPYYWSRYYGLDPYAWHYRNAGRYGQPFDENRANRPRPRAYSYVPPSAAIYHRQPDTPDEAVPNKPAPAPNKSPQKSEPEIHL